jgi:hypothetical protein
MCGAALVMDKSVVLGGFAVRVSIPSTITKSTGWLVSRRLLTTPDCRLRSRATWEALTEYEQAVFYALNQTNAQSAVDSGLLEPNHQRKPGMPMTNLISENTPIEQRLIVQKNEPNLWQEAANRTKEKLVRFPPIDRVLADIVQNKQFQDA